MPGAAFTHGTRGIAATTNLLNNSLDSNEASPGLKAIIQLIYTSHGLTPPVTVAEHSPQDYYSASLLLLARLAKTETNF